MPTPNHITGASCVRPNYYNEVIDPVITEILPPPDTTSAKIIEHFSGAYGVTNALRADMCQGKLTDESAKYGGRFVGRSSATVVSIPVSVGLVALGGIIASLPGAIVGLAAGTALVYAAPEIGELVLAALGKTAGKVLTGTGEYIKSSR